ncbi:uncharacterized protein LOC129581360 [Paramacrobiotus metropolitanus]|uniref:uncharacterized protein LOC129581360 n=1 Tax=Paramacrobiotus metropolitanus TaxID=2943436 RepID=UPI0024457A87|nr:uncharacterized protein LOC129581360 [Paramacrobiotus metropolitanus]
MTLKSLIPAHLMQYLLLLYEKPEVVFGNNVLADSFGLAESRRTGVTLREMELIELILKLTEEEKLDYQDDILCEGTMIWRNENEYLIAQEDNSVAVPKDSLHRLLSKILASDWGRGVMSIDDDLGERERLL